MFTPGYRNGRHYQRLCSITDFNSRENYIGEDQSKRLNALSCRNRGCFLAYTHIVAHSSWGYLAPRSDIPAQLWYDLLCYCILQLFPVSMQSHKFTRGSKLEIRAGWNTFQTRSRIRGYLVKSGVCGHSNKYTKTAKCSSMPFNCSFEWFIIGGRRVES